MQLIATVSCSQSRDSKLLGVRDWSRSRQERNVQGKLVNAHSSLFASGTFDAKKHNRALNPFLLRTPTTSRP